ncbi:MAG: hypothetical protein FWE05_07160 [Defluviitaleaceae bacterium]|jgi:hypothetical protein|nr:hypothetical protein [Defluviitaleaceae bacterium]
MLDWKKLMKGKPFITDLGKNELSPLRYAVWSPLKNSESHQVVEVSETLEGMMEKYKIPQERVCYVVQNT